MNVTAPQSQPQLAKNIIMDIPVMLSVELGQTQIEVREMLALGTGSVIELNKSQDEPVDLLVNGRLVARGQVVLVNDKLGVKITEILKS